MKNKKIKNSFARIMNYDIKKIETFILRRMVKDHPEWTKEDYAEVSGLSVRTIYRRFKKDYEYINK